jgi:hypothetical protein
MAFGHRLPARVHSVNAHNVNAKSDFSRVDVHPMQFLHSSKPKNRSPRESKEKL